MFCWVFHSASWVFPWQDCWRQAVHLPWERAVSRWRAGQASSCCVPLSCDSETGILEGSGHCQLSPRDECSHHLKRGDSGRRTRPCHPSCWHTWLQDPCNPQKQLVGAMCPPPLSFWGRDPKASSAESHGAAGSFARCQAAPVGTCAPVLGPDPASPGKQHWERLGYFKQVMSVLPPRQLSPLSLQHWLLWQDGFTRLKGPMV